MIPIRPYISLLSTYLGNVKRRLIVLALVTLTGIGFQLFLPQIIGSFIDRAITGATQEQLLPLAGWFLVAALGKQVLSVVATWLAEDVSWRSTNGLRRDLIMHAVDVDVGFHKQHTPGKLIERVDGDVTTQSAFFRHLRSKLSATEYLSGGFS